MNDTLLKFLITTYSVLLPIAIAYIVKQVSTMRHTRVESRNAFTSLTTKMDELTRIVSENQMRTSRYRIIRFDDEKSHGMEHSDDHCEQILEDCDIYRAYCMQHPEFQNHKGQGAMKRIEIANNMKTLTEGGYRNVQEQCI